jgi:D-alanine-D-alanine ligase
MKKKIGVLTGGYTAEIDISLKSAVNVMNQLDKDKFDTYLIYIDPLKWVYIDEQKNEKPINRNDFSIELDGQKIKFDCVVFFPLHGSPTEDGKIQGYFDMIGQKYVGCGVLEASLTFDKAATKKYLANSGVLMAKSKLYFNHEKREDILAHVKQDLTLPLFVKPNKNGSSYGISKVNDWSDLDTAITKGFEFDNELIIEEFISGREMSIGVYNIGGVVRSLHPTEIKSQNDFFDYKAKYLGESAEITPAEISEELTKKLQEINIKAYIELGLKGYARIDYIMKGEDFYMLEANTTPGFTSESLLPQQLRYAQIEVKGFFTQLIEEALDR